MVVPDQLPQLLGVILLPSKVKVMESKSPSSKLEMPRVTDVTPLQNTATLTVGTVFHMFSLSPAMEFNPKPGAVRQH